MSIIKTNVSTLSLLQQLNKGQDIIAKSASADGPEGPPGPQGEPGEVSAAELAGAIAGTSANSDAVAVLEMAVSDPPTQAIADKVDELINALRR